MTSKPKTVLLVTYGGGHAQMIWPLVHALRQFSAWRNGALDLRVLALPAARAILQDHAVENFSFADYLDPQQDVDAIEWGTELAQQHHSPSSGIDIRESIAYLGLSYKDLVLRHGVDPAAEMMAQKGRHAFFPLTVMSRIFDDIRPDFVITTNSPRSEAAAIKTANQRGIDNLIMTDLFTGLGDYPLEARNISFLNRFASDKFTQDGLVDASRSQFHFTGNPAFDRLLVLPREAEPGWLQRSFPAAEAQNAVLHADAPAYWDPLRQCSHFRSDDEILEELDAAYQAVMQNQALYLIRPHPSQEPALYLRWIKGRRNAFLAIENDLHDLLRNISLLLVRTSTVGLEAAYMHKRVLQLDCDFHDDLPLARMGVGWGVNGFTELGQAIGNALVDAQGYQTILRRIEEVLPSAPAAEKLAKIVLDKLCLAID